MNQNEFYNKFRNGAVPLLSGFKMQPFFKKWTPPKILNWEYSSKFPS